MTPNVLKVDNIKKRFGELEVLHGLSLEAQKGDVISAGDRLHPIHCDPACVTMRCEVHGDLPTRRVVFADRIGAHDRRGRLTGGVVQKHKLARLRDLNSVLH